MSKLTHQAFVAEVFEIGNCLEGSELEQELQALGDKWEAFLGSRPLPESLANWVDELWEIVDNLEGAELERELQSFLIKDHFAGKSYEECKHLYLYVQLSRTGNLWFEFVKQKGEE